MSDGSPIAIDLHAHVLDRDVIERLRTLAPEHGSRVVEADEGFYLERSGNRRLGPIPAGMFDLERRVADMDASEVAVQLLSVPPFEFHYELEADLARQFAPIQNDSIRTQVARFPDRFQMFATLPLQDSGATLAEIERVAAWPEVRGVEIGTNVAGANLDAEHLEPVWAALEARDLGVWIHSGLGTMAAADRLGRYYLQNLIGNPLESTIAIASLIFGGVLERYPALRFGFVHGGGFSPYQLGRWDHGWSCRPEPRAVIEVPPSAYYARMFFDCLTHNEDSLEFLGRTAGWSHIVIGSDYPFDMGEDDPVGTVRRLDLPEADLHAVLRGNAERFMRPR
jgi:aminocarboxymuconate-semialdehyde decarboxylase